MKAGPVMRWANYLVETFSNPQQFASAEDYLAALDECLVELCTIKGTEPPDLSSVTFRGES